MTESFKQGSKDTSTEQNPTSRTDDGKARAERVAIIGGGASGMVLAYLLDKQGYAVSVFEQQPMLGGNIRTITQNIDVENHDPGTILEGGVIEFSNGFHQFRALLDELEVPYEKVEVGTGLFFQNGGRVLSPYMLDQNFSGWQRLVGKIRYMALQLPALALLMKLRSLRPGDVSGKSLADVLDSDRRYAIWARNFMMYSYSIAHESIHNFPAELALLNLKNYMRAGWYRIIGGVYSYIDAIVEKFDGDIFLNSYVEKVVRNQGSIELRFAGDNVNTFDRVVFATPPDQILAILDDASSDEFTMFSDWHSNTAVTTIHKDSSMYEKYNVAIASEFDFFETGTGWGYNALLNNVCGLQAEPPYYLSYNLEHLIDPDMIVHQMSHQTPGYSAKAMRNRSAIIANNGTNRTYFVGAWLSDGLHEGAVESAQRVAELFVNRVN